MTQPPAPGAPRRPARFRVLPFLLGLGAAALTSVAPNLGHGRDAFALLAGLFVGALLAVQLQALVGLALGRLGGTAPALLMIGAGRLLGVRRLRGVTLLVRPIPLVPLLVGEAVVAVDRLRPRLFLNGLLRVAVPAGLGVALMWTDTPLRYLGTGLLLVPLLLLTAPRTPGTIGWMLLRAPFADAGLLPQLALGERELTAQRALMGARVAEARAALDGVPADTLSRVRLHAAVDVVSGRYAEAVEALLGAPGARGLAPRVPGEELLLARAGLLAAEAGVMPREDALAAAAIGVALAGERTPRLLAATDILATQALLNGRAADAALLARGALRRMSDQLTRAYCLCTLAAAQSVTGDQPAARANLAQARALAPELARIATVERLIDELPLMRDRV
ncbi:hypothetical protein [Streptacidiphilus neutrinimicus]|uniref:hypothetical protein n=1 Tax=Streptacidiphilus neutrinimicus TaxID=105420 RepID=UPI0005A9F369|nr:hypothetical protein [Streptacidiphilus neutrinimicus]